jgi:NAD(P)-dependent dehydrogenase (short-subunit alcohol dehydrogenase family)
MNRDTRLNLAIIDERDERDERDDATPTRIIASGTQLFVAVGPARRVACCGHARGRPPRRPKRAAGMWLSAWANVEGATRVVVRAVWPGRTVTPRVDRSMLGGAAAQEQTIERYTREVLAVVPLTRFLDPFEIAAALYLADDGPRPAVLTVGGGEVPH